MKNDYTTYSNEQLTKQVLDNITVGDLIKFNNSKSLYRAVAANEDYIIAIHKGTSRNSIYTIIEKQRSTETRDNYNKGYFRFGLDDFYCSYRYYNLEDCQEALDRLHDGLTFRHKTNFYRWEETTCEATKKYNILALATNCAKDLTTISFKHTLYNNSNIQNWIDKVFANFIQEDMADEA